MKNTRRSFIQAAAALPAAAAAVTPAPPLPTVKFFGKDVSKLIIGSNPFYGYGHSVPLLDHFLRDWMTADRRHETLKMADANGLGTWQVGFNMAAYEDWKRYLDSGGKMNVLVLADPNFLLKDRALLAKVAKELKPIGIAHHGNRTDDYFRDGKMDVVHDFVKTVQDLGVPAGVSTHNPKVVEFVEEKGWKNDYYMTCLYRVTRDPAEVRAQIGDAPLGEIFMEKDPERMTDVVLKTKKTCFAFKLLGAGRNTRGPQAIENAFRYALSRIKPQDAVIVGMCPKFKDEVRENAELVRRLLAQRTS